MTSISAASTNTYQSPLQKLQDELLSEVNSGAISSSDKDALSSALTDIDSAMQASRASDQASGTRPSPDQLKSKIDDLIAGEVSSGKLTSDQATERQGVFWLLHRTSDRLSDLKTFRHGDARHSHPFPKREA